MKKILSVLAIVAVAMPVVATPRAFDGGFMVDVPNVGLSRVETVTFCLNDVGVDKYQDLLTDNEYVKFESCLLSNT